MTGVAEGEARDFGQYSTDVRRACGRGTFLGGFKG